MGPPILLVTRATAHAKASLLQRAAIAVESSGGSGERAQHGEDAAEGEGDNEADHRSDEKRVLGLPV